MFTMINKHTGEEIVFPTPDDKPVSIETLPSGHPLSDKEIDDYFAFHLKRKSKLPFIRKNLK